MKNEQDLYKEAVQHYQTGNLSEAENIFRQILTINPQHAPSLHVMGIIGVDVQRYEIAEELVRKAVALQNNNPSFHFTLGRVLGRQDKKEKAIESYKKALALKPDFTDALNNLGTMLFSLKKLDEASDVFTKILKRDPKNFNALCNMGSIAYQKDKYEESIAHYRAALEIDPERTNVYYDLGIALIALNRPEEALPLLLKATKLKPDYVDALLSIGNIYRQKGALAEALSYYSKIKSIEPNENAYVGIAATYLEQDRTHEALMEIEQAERELPKSCPLTNFLGTIYDKLSQYEKAIECYDRAIELDPEEAEAYANKGTVLKKIGRLQEAVAEFKKAIKLQPLSWIYSNLLLTLLYADFVTPEEFADIAREFGERIADPVIRERPFSNDRNPDRKLRIGYVSPDFRQHSVSYFLSPLYKYNKNNFEVFAYSKVEQEDHVTQDIKGRFDHWRDIRHMKPDEAADLIEQDKIDILVDLTGHTANNGLMIFARKPAPIQASWLGYSATTGMKAMDYRITDIHAEPIGMAEHLNTEKLWRLPDIFVAYTPSSSPDVIDHPPFDDNGFITFGCLNNFTKVTDPVLDTWAKIMAQVPDSKLLMEISGISSEKLRAEIEERIVKRGIPKERLILIPFSRSNQYILYNKIDLALDPFPAVGGTTSMDTLWMGVPFVTLAGKHSGSRLGVTILANAGLPELIAQNTDEYISIAVDLAQDREKLRGVRHNLRERVASSPLMDEEKFVHNMEDAYRQMWQTWLSSTGHDQR